MSDREEVLFDSDDAVFVGIACIVGAYRTGMGEA